MKVYTYYQDINFKSQDSLLEIWKKSWEKRGYEAIILNKKDAEKSVFYEEFVSKIKFLHEEIANKPLNEYGLSCWLRWLAYSTQSEEKFYVCDYDVINHHFDVTKPDDFLCLLDADCPCIASGTPSQFYGLCLKFINETSEYKQQFVKAYREFNFTQYHDQEFFRIYYKINQYSDIKYSRNRENFLGIPGEGEFWKKQLVHYAHSMCNIVCKNKGIEFNEEVRCSLIKEYLAMSYESLFLSDCIKDFSPVCGRNILNADNSLNELGKKITLTGVKQLVPSIHNFLKLIDLKLPEIEKYTENNKNENSEKIKELFNRHGSDKSAAHDYHLVYSEVFEKLNKIDAINILEIGIGSQNPLIPSRMCALFKVGGSHRAYREYFPNAQIFGADIDKDTLFSEDRIKTSYVDQLDPITFEEMHKNFNSPAYDLIVEDGLHSFVASLNTLNFALKYIKKGGVIVLEDLNNEGKFWNMIHGLLLDNNYNSRLINSNGLMLVVYL